MTQPVADPYDMSAAAVLPERAPAWSCRSDRALLLVHDVPTELDTDREPLRDLAHNLGQLRDTCHELGVPVARSTTRFDGGPGPGEHWLADLSADHFGGLRALLDSFGRDQLVLTGVQVFCVVDDRSRSTCTPCGPLPTTARPP